MKTFEQWNMTELSITEFLQPGDQVDETMFDHFAGEVVPQYLVGQLLQTGEAHSADRGRYLYLTFAGYGERYLYLGILPPFKQPKW